MEHTRAHASSRAALPRAGLHCKRCIGVAVPLWHVDEGPLKRRERWFSYSTSAREGSYVAGRSSPAAIALFTRDGGSLTPLSEVVVLKSGCSSCRPGLSQLKQNICSV